MAYFFAVVLAVLLTLGLAAIVAFWLFKRWLRRKMGDYMQSATLVDPRYARPARLQFDVAEDAEPGEPMGALWTRCHALGFRLLADWGERSGGFALLRVARHETLPIALVLTEAADEAQSAAFAMFVTGSSGLHALSDAQGPAIATPAMTWEVDPALTPELALARLDGEAREPGVRQPELRLIEAVYERAWASRIDLDLASPPDRAATERRAAGRTFTPNQIEQAFSIEVGQWRDQVTAAVLDRYRRASRIDAVSWERQRDGVQVVHDLLRRDDIRGFFDGDQTIDALFAQLEAQGLTGIALYEQVLARTPAARMRRRLGEVDRPLRAVVYGRDEAEPAVAAPRAQPHTYEALDDAGKPVHGAVFAQDSTDARRQLDALGLSDARILSEPLGAMPESLREFAADPEMAAVAARAAREPLWLALLRAIWANKWLWAPPSALLVWTWLEGAPYGWGDYLVFGYAALAFAAVLLFVAPMFLYNQLLLARVRARWRTAAGLLSLLSLLNVSGGMTKAQLVGERCKIEASRGRLEQALARWRRLESELPPADYAQGLVSIYDAVGDHARMIEAQRSFLQHAAAKEMASVDLALSLARHTGAHAEAESLLASTSPQNLSELALGGYHFARGLILAERGQTDLALRQYHEALERMRQFRSMPLIAGLIAEINGYAALTLKRAGRIEQADSLWHKVRDVLALHASCRGLVQRYERA